MPQPQQAYAILTLMFFLLAILLMLVAFMPAEAQDSVRIVMLDTVRTAELRETSAAANDSVLTAIMLKRMREQADTLAHAKDDRTTLFPRHLSFADSVRIASYAELHHAANPMLLPLYSDPHFWDTDTITITKAKNKRHDIPLLCEIENRKIIDKLRARTIRYIETHNMDLIAGAKSQLPSVAEITHLEKKEQRRHGITIKNDSSSNLSIGVTNSLWSHKVKLLAQATQNYATRNWHKGPANSIAIIASAKATFTYDNAKKISWKNEIEWRAGVSTVSGDTLRKVAVTDDLLRITSTFGYRAVKKLYYSAYAELSTQLFRTYQGTNKPNLRSTCFNPLRLNLGLGLEYKPNKDFSLSVSPAALKYIYVGDSAKVAPAQYGIAAGKRQLAEFGSTVRLDWTWKPRYWVEIDTRLFFYTNYRAVEVELEINSNFIINQYLSAQVSIYPRIDNTVPPLNGSHSYWQFKELLSIGFSHTF
ncbi:MAG: DUF3078 domain-containing protein [Paludibacteraceae bacterium]|nr:DUF3078 domain-containing protein [Paludibacteraceae bacterium]